MTREQLISLLATIGSVALFKLITRLIPPKTIAQRERERQARELLKSNKDDAKDLLAAQEVTASDLKDTQAVDAVDLKSSQEYLARHLDEDIAHELESLGFQVELEAPTGPEAAPAIKPVIQEPKLREKEL